MKSFKKRSIYLVSGIVLFCVAGMSAQEKTQKKGEPWKELVAFHSVMAATFHPVEEGNFKPIRERAGELNNAANAWAKSKFTGDYDKPEIHQHVELLAKLTGELKNSVDKGDGNDEIQRQLTEAHEVFHKVVGLCKPSSKEHHEHEGDMEKEKSVDEK